jgi:hypothetical protein
MLVTTQFSHIIIQYNGKKVIHTSYWIDIKRPHYSYFVYENAVIRIKNVDLTSIYVR